MVVIIHVFSFGRVCRSVVSTDFVVVGNLFPRENGLQLQVGAEVCRSQFTFDRCNFAGQVKHGVVVNVLLAKSLIEGFLQVDKRLPEFLCILLHGVEYRLNFFLLLIRKIEVISVVKNMDRPRIAVQLGSKRVPGSSPGKKVINLLFRKRPNFPVLKPRIRLLGV